jgi:hypothetical protein
MNYSERTRRSRYNPSATAEPPKTEAVAFAAKRISNASPSKPVRKPSTSFWQPVARPPHSRKRRASQDRFWDSPRQN